MSQPLTLPIPAADLSRLIALEWGGERGVARCAGVDPAEIGAGLLAGGLLTWYTRSGPSDVLPDAAMAAADRALSSLADALEDAGLVVDREGGACRVVGWAATVCTTCELGWRGWSGQWRGAHVARDLCPMCQGYPERPVRLASLPPSDPRRSRHDAAVLAARLARGGPPVVDERRERALATWRRAYGGGR